MGRPFVVRVHDDDPHRARALADALTEPLVSRGARVRYETSARGRPGTGVSVGIADFDEGAQWLAPLDVEARPQEAAQEIVRFLERWGFIVAATRDRLSAPASSKTDGV